MALRLTQEAVARAVVVRHKSEKEECLTCTGQPCRFKTQQRHALNGPHILINKQTCAHVQTHTHTCTHTRTHTESAIEKEKEKTQDTGLQ